MNFTAQLPNGMTKDAYREYLINLKKRVQKQSHVEFIARMIAKYDEIKRRDKMEGTGIVIKGESFEAFCESVERMFQNKPTRANMAATVYAFRKAIFDEIVSKAFEEGEDAGSEEERPHEPVADMNDLD